MGGRGLAWIGVEFGVEAAVAGVGWYADYSSFGCCCYVVDIIIAITIVGLYFSQAGNGGCIAGGCDLDCGLCGIEECHFGGSFP